MKALRVRVWRYDRDRQCFLPCESHMCASPKRAEQWALGRLGEFVGSWYEIRVEKRRPFATVEPRKIGRRNTHISQPCHEVPSCGDRGFW